MRALFTVLFGVVSALNLGACKPPSRGTAAVLAPDAGGANADALKQYWQVPAFELIDQDARKFNSGEMIGKVWVVDFFYTTCPGPCPALTSRLSNLHKAFAGDSRVGFLSISTDPEKDQPDVLRKYADKFGADARWRFLTGKTSTVFALANNGFKLSLTGSKDGIESGTHSTRLALVDGSGWVCGFFEGVGDEDSASTARLTEGIHTLLKGLK